MIPADQVHASSSYLSDVEGHGYIRLITTLIVTFSILLISTFTNSDMYGQVILNGPYPVNGSPHTSYAIPNTTNQQTAAAHQTIRTVYLGNILADMSITEVLDNVKSGTILSVRPYPEKNVLFIAFVEPSAAAHFYNQATKNHLTINGVELKVGWGKPSPIHHNIHLALQNGATRNVFLGSLDETATEESLREDLSRFGFIEHIKMIPEKHIAFVHFLCINNAMRCVNTLPAEPNWRGRRIYYGKDRCGQKSLNMSPQQQPQQQAYTTYSHNPATFQIGYPPMTYDMYTGAPVEFYPAPQGTVYNSSSSLAGVANRTIYLGNIHPDTTSEDICNVIRGGILSQIRFMPDKHIAFITFVDPALAASFYNQASFHYLVIKNRRLKIGWGKPTALPPLVLNAVVNGGSRNVYIGNIDSSITEEKLKHDFSEYGDIELVNTLEEKNCAFVNFTSILSAVHAIEGIRSKEEYKRFRINYGKDRCGNQPRVQQTPRPPQAINPNSPIEEMLTDIE
jgi:RNA recognition motif-containing protein